MKTNIKVLAFSGLVLLAIGCGEASNKKDVSEVDRLDRTITTDSVKVTTNDAMIQNKSVEKDEYRSTSPSAKQLSTEKPETDKYISPLSGSSSAAVENIKDTLHKFIRTADIKCKVGNVEKTTYKIEDIAANHGGFVTYTNLSSNVNNATKIQVSADSSAETTSFTVTNSITLRVPNTQLDTTLKDLAKLVGFLDYRVIKAEDISLQLLANNLLQKRTAQHTQRLAKDIDANPKKLDASVDAEDNLLAKQEAADNATISNLSMAEQRQYSTVKLELYQPETVATVIVFNPKPIPEYRAGFALRLWHALQFGWGMLEEIFLAVINFWVLILLGLAGYIWYRKYVKVPKAGL